MFEFVGEVMSRGLCLVPGDLPVALVAALMRQEAVDTVVVGTSRRHMGILTATDILVRVTAAGANPDTVTAGDVCTNLRVTTAPDEELTAALATMHLHDLQVIAVLTHGEVVGLLTWHTLGLAVWPTLTEDGSARRGPLP